MEALFLNEEEIEHVSDDFIIWFLQKYNHICPYNKIELLPKTRLESLLGKITHAKILNIDEFGLETLVE